MSQAWPTPSRAKTPSFFGRSKRAVEGAAQAVELERGPPVLAEIAGEAFVQGVVLYLVVLYLGRATVPFGPPFTAVPLDALW